MLLSANPHSEGIFGACGVFNMEIGFEPICTGRHIFGRGSATADRENEPSIPYNMAWLSSHLPPANSNLEQFSAIKETV